MSSAARPTWTITVDGQALGGAGGGVLPRALRCEIGMDGVGACHVDLIVPEGAALPAVGAALVVQLGLDDDNSAVFTGEVDGVRASAAGAQLSAGDGLARLAHCFVTGAYEDQSAGKVARDILSQAGLRPGAVDEGPTLKSYVLFPGLSALHHLGRLGVLAGADLFADGEGKVHFAAPATQGARHSFRYGLDLLEVDLLRAPSARAGVDVWGEGAASSAGSDKAHWLPQDLSGVKGKADLPGDPPYAAPAAVRREFVRDGALRTGDDAAASAKARAAARRPVRGAIVTLGAPALAPGDLVALEDLPSAHPLAALAQLGPFRVRRVRHRFDVSRGFTSRMEL